MSDELEDLRSEVDQIDSLILGQLNRRAELVARIGQTKSRSGSPIYQPAREAKVIGRAVEANQGPLSNSAVAAIFNQIMVSGRSLEKALTIAFLGPEHTFTHQASQIVFSGGASYEATSSIGEVFDRVERGSVDYGVVPIENSTAGTVGETLDRFAETSARIVGETTLAITHHLLSKGPVEGIKVVYSHPQALQQCRGWLTTNLPDAEQVEVASTAAASARASSEENAAAIGLIAGAEAYGLRVAKSDIQDFASNTTRFFVLGRESNPSTGDDKTALVFTVVDRVGALHDTLEVLRNRNINLSNIQTRPARGRSHARSGDYLFFVELDGHPEDALVDLAIAEMRSVCTLVKVLGEWPSKNYRD